MSLKELFDRDGGKGKLALTVTDDDVLSIDHNGEQLLIKFYYKESNTKLAFLGPRSFEIKRDFKNTTPKHE